LKLVADVSLQAAAGKPKRVSILAYGGGVMSVSGWGRLIVDLAGLTVPEQLTILGDHDNRLSSIIGSGQPINDGRSLRLDGVLADSETASQVIALAKSGVQLKASVGITPSKVERREKKGIVNINHQQIEVAAGTQIVRSGHLDEISIVAVPADQSSSVTVAAFNQRKSDMPMPDEEITTTETVADEIETSRELLAAEYRRIAAIREICGDKHDSICATAIAGGWDAQKTKLAVLRAGYSKAPLIISRTTPEATDQILSAALCARANGSFAEKCFDATTLERSRAYQSMSLLELCKLVNDANGIHCENRDEHVRAAFSPAIRGHSGFSTVSLPKILDNVLSKTLLAEYAEFPSTWRSISDVRSVSNFHDATALRANITGRLMEHPPAGEIVHLTMGETSMGFRISTWARMLSITRRDLINDSLDAFSTIPRSLARMAARSLSDHVWRTILMNKDFSGNTFFQAANENTLSGAGSALQFSSLSDAIKLLRKRVDAEGGPIDLGPQTLVVSPELETNARQLLNSSEVSRLSSSDQMPVGNPLASLIATLDVEPRISTSSFVGSSTTAWYLFSARSNSAVIVAFLDGRDTPTIESDDTDFNSLGRQWRVYHDYGCALGDPAAAVKSAGA
jgi:hypothetical protein